MAKPIQLKKINKQDYLQEKKKSTLEPDDLTIMNAYTPTNTAQNVVEREEKLREET